MLYLKISAVEGFDEKTGQFVEIKPAVTLQLEHSLLSLSKWESKWHKPFLSKEKKTVKETIDYIRCMTINKNVDKSVYTRLTPEHIEAVQAYMADPHTATTIRQSNKNTLHTPTSEEIYYSMFYHGISIECEKWHLNNLLTLLAVANVKSGGQKKMSKKDTYKMYEELNAVRRAMTGSKG